ncbi:MAG: NTP transferase domain-containing protein [Opitutaceae bacterium]
MRPARLAGVVLVGGRSARMGRDKGRIQVAGVELWRRQLGVLMRAGARPALLSLRPGQRSFGWRGGEIRDAAANAGPLGGVAAALAAAPAPLVAVLAVDLPHMDAAWFRRLGRRCRPGSGAVVRGPLGYEPLAAIYPREAAALCMARLRAGRLSLQSLLSALVRQGRMAVLPMRMGDGARLANWNTREDAGGRDDGGAGWRARPQVAPAKRQSRL